MRNRSCPGRFRVFDFPLRGPSVLVFVGLLLLCAGSSLTWAQQRSGFPSDPVGYWPFDRSVRDAGPNELDGTLKGAARIVSSSKFGAGALAVGGRGILHLSDSERINMAEFMSRRSVSAWFRLKDVGLGKRKQVIWNEGGIDRGLNIYVYDGKLYVGAWNEPERDKWGPESGWNGNWISTNEIESGTWHHVVAVLDGRKTVQPDVLTGYLDGAKFGTAEGSGIWLHHGDPSIGAVAQSTKFHDTGDVKQEGGHAVTGRIDDVRVYNRVLTPREIQALWNMEETERARADAEKPGAGGEEGASPRPDPAGNDQAGGEPGASEGGDADATVTDTSGPDVPEAQKHRTGHYQITVPGFDPEVLKYALKSMRTRRGRGGGVTTVEQFGHEYAQIAGKSVEYEVDVPDSYTPGVSHGIMVFIASNETGRIPGSFRELLAEYKLIGIGANDAGNGVFPPLRHAAAVQAVRLLKRRYNIDEERIYLAGMSGGGKMASIVMFLNAGTFDGGFPMCGAVDALANPFGERPADGLLRHAARNNRFVFHTGESDFNRDSVKAIAEKYMKKGFRYVKYLEQPNAGHKVASRAYVKKALESLDAPLKKKRKKDGKK